MDFRHLREELRQARERAGLTLDQAAAASGLNRSTIHSIENIKREPHLQPEIETLEKLANAYDRTLLLSLAPNQPLPFVGRSVKNVASTKSSKVKAASDDALSSLSEDEIRRIIFTSGHAVSELVEELTKRESARRGHMDREQDSGARPQEGSDGDRDRRTHRRVHRRKTAKRHVESENNDE